MKRVMVVDDATTVRMYHRQLMEQVGYEVVEAENGVEGLEKALTTPVDLLLVDVNMPKMDGYNFLLAVRATPELAAIPAIMISTEDRPVDREQAYRAGANLYMVKPVKPEAIEARVALMAGEAS